MISFFDCPLFFLFFAKKILLMKNVLILLLFLLAFALNFGLAISQVDSMPKNVEKRENQILKCQLSPNTQDLPSPLTDSQKLKFSVLAIQLAEPNFSFFFLNSPILKTAFCSQYWTAFRSDIIPPPPKF